MDEAEGCGAGYRVRGWVEQEEEEGHEMGMAFCFVWNMLLLGVLCS